MSFAVDHHIAECTSTTNLLMARYRNVCVMSPSTNKTSEQSLHFVSPARSH